MNVPYSKHKEMIHETFSASKNLPQKLSPHKEDRKPDQSTMVKTNSSNQKKYPNNQTQTNVMSNLSDFEKFRASFHNVNEDRNDASTYDQAYKESVNLSNYLDNQNKDVSNASNSKSNNNKENNMFIME